MKKFLSILIMTMVFLTGSLIDTATTKAETNEYRWVLKQVIDIDGKEAWKKANEHPSYEYTWKYSRGNLSFRQAYEGPSDTDKSIKRPKIHGESLTIQGGWSGVPKIIQKNQIVTLNLALSVVENSQSYFTFHGQMYSDIVGIAPDGQVTGAQLRTFSNKDKKYFFVLSKQSNYQTIDEKVSNQFINGSKEGDKIGIRIGISNGSVLMGAVYIYEWTNKPVS